MSTSTSEIINNFSKQITTYLGLPILVLGVVGGVLNIIVFLTLKTFRQSACAFLLTAMSFVNVGQLLTSLLSRILISGFDINLTETSTSFCKFRSYCLQVCTLTSYTCICLATLDQFLATSLRVRWQQSLTVRRAHLLCVIFFIVWLLHSIPCLLFYSPVLSARSNTILCSNTNPVYEIYLSYGYMLVLTGLLPIAITILFGSLAYWHVRQIPYRTVSLVRRELDKQLTSMVLVQVVHNFFVIVPYITTLIVVHTLNITIQSPNYIASRLANASTGFLYYSYFAGPFYIYVCVSKRFRQQLLYILAGVHLKQCRKPEVIGINQVIPQTL